MRSIADLEGIIERIKSKAADVEIVWESEAWKVSSSLGTSSPPPPRHISVLDSSFNPPTLAHLSLALAVPPTNAEDGKKGSTSPSGHLLLLSVRNADKELKPGGDDASFAQRLQMMILLAEEMETRLSAAEFNSSAGALNGVSSDNGRTTTTTRPVAVAAIDEPTFVGKSKKLLEYFRRIYPNNPNPNPDPDPDPDVVTTTHSMPRLTLVLGYDTLTRFFDPKYYGSHHDMTTCLRAFFHDDRSSIMCARRRLEEQGGSESANDAISSDNHDKEEMAFLHSADVVEPYLTGAVSMFDIDPKQVSSSSTLVRRSIASMTPAAGTPTSTPTDLLPARDWRSMVPSAIAAYITSQSLYISKG